MPLISTLCLRVLIVGTKASVFKQSGVGCSLAKDPAVYDPKLFTRRVEVTTNIEYERVRPWAHSRPSHGPTQMRYAVVRRRAEDRQLTVMGY
jgi:hypothetical protein